MNRIRLFLVAAALVAAPSALAVSPAPLSAAADGCTLSCCIPSGDCCGAECAVALADTE